MLFLVSHTTQKYPECLLINTCFRFIRNQLRYTYISKTSDAQIPYKLLWEFHITYTHSDIHPPHTLFKCLTVACAMQTLCQVLICSVGGWTLSKRCQWISNIDVFYLLLNSWVQSAHRELTLPCLRLHFPLYLK